MFSSISVFCIRIKYIKNSQLHRNHEIQNIEISVMIICFFEYQFALFWVPILEVFKKIWIDSDSIWELQGAQNSSSRPPPDPLIQGLRAQLSPRRLQEGFQGHFGWVFEPPKVILEVFGSDHKMI